VSIPIEIKNPSAEVVMQPTLKGKSCDCAGYTLVPEKIAPGQTGLLTVNASLSNQTEFRNLSLKFTTRLDDPAEMHVTTQVRSFPQIEFSPATLPVLSIPFGSSKELKFDVFCHQLSDEASTIASIDSDSDELEVGVVSEEQVSKFGVQRKVLHCKATIRVPSRIGSHADDAGRSALLKVQFGEVAGSLRVVWRPEALIQVQPPRILVNARTTAEAGHFTKAVTLGAESAFQIEAIQTDDPDLVVEGNLDVRKKSHTILVTLSGQSGDDAPKKWAITVKTDHPEEPEVRVAVFLF
jgi:hypothetical protein